MHSNAGIRVHLNEGHCQLHIVVKLHNNILRSFLRMKEFVIESK